MVKPKIMFVNQEMMPYTQESPTALFAKQLAEYAQKHGSDVRVFMPKFGDISERRHQLHEVIRLSGINIVVNDIDYALIVKVGAISETLKLQTYFIEHDDFFKKHLTDAAGKLSEEVDSKMIYFVHSIVETMIRLNWIPDIIHCTGWFSAIFPMYVRRVYKDRIGLKKCKFVTTLGNVTFNGKIGKNMQKKLAFDKVPEKDLERFKDTDYAAIMKAAMGFSDAIVVADEETNLKLISYGRGIHKNIIINPVEELPEACRVLYQNLLIK
ncbi:glycogen synthase [Bacteroidia bacterium]|nr:glycogen synthase [Bacteroidia bacterium]